jgi:5,10-methylenetetrahydromethanopterin reductase
MAAAVATLDRLSNGRAFLGLGRGQPEWYERALGVRVGKPLQVLEETIGLLRAWWRPPYRASGEAVAGGAPFFPVHEWERVIGPVQQVPPVYLAAVGPKALELAGRLADGMILNDLASPTFAREADGRLRSAARAAGRDPEGLSVFLRGGLTVTDDPEPVLERSKTTIAMIHALPGMERLLETPGFDTEAIIGEVRRLMRTDEVLARGGGFADLRRAGDVEAARKAIPTELVARLALVGPLTELRARLAELAAVGVTHVFVSPPAAETSAEDWAEQLRELSAIS